MEIIIYKDNRCNDFTGTNVYGGIDTVIAFLRKKMKRNKCNVFTYCWDEDGSCAMSDDEECCVERDAEKMLSLVSGRLDKFGYCRFGCKIGEVVIKDYSNVAFLEKLVKATEAHLNMIK